MQVDFSQLLLSDQVILQALGLGRWVHVATSDEYFRLGGCPDVMNCGSLHALGRRSPEFPKMMVPSILVSGPKRCADGFGAHWGPSSHRKHFGALLLSGQFFKSLVL